MWDPLQISSDFDIDDVQNYAHNPICRLLHEAITTRYFIKPTFSYSKCSMQRGWNLKYIKSGKTLCTIYPKQGYLEVLIVLSKKREEELLALCNQVCPSIRHVLQETQVFQEQRWLTFVLEDEEQIKDILLVLSKRLSPPTPKKDS